MIPHLVLLSTFCLRLKCNEKCTKCSFPFTNEEVLQLSRIRCPCHKNEVELEWQQLPAFRKAITGSKGKLRVFCTFCTLLNLLPKSIPGIQVCDMPRDRYWCIYYYILWTSTLLLSHSSSRVSSSGTTNLTFGSTCCNFPADWAKRNTISTWTFEIPRSANISNYVRNSKKFVLLFKVLTIQIVITCSLYLY